MTPLEKLDYVLGNIRSPISNADVRNNLGKDEKLNVNEFDFAMIINKLRRDGYIDFIENGKYANDKQFEEGVDVRRNFDGDLFVENAGYVKQSDATAIAERIKNNRERQLSTGTVLLAIGTFLLVLTEVLIHWNELRHVFSCH